MPGEALRDAPVIIDAHHHLWRLSRADYGWLTPDLAPLYHDFEPADLSPLMRAAGVRGGIVVQAAETESETRFLLDLARSHETLLGVVGWTDFAAPDAPDAIETLAADANLKGLRPMLQDLPDDDFILSPVADAALAEMTRQGLRLDALVRPRHLSRLPVLRRRHPDLAMVIDHGAKPFIAEGLLQPWADDIRRVATDGVTCCKLSGLLTEAGERRDDAALAPYVEVLLETFGPQRLMWGSDWPVLRLAGDYQTWLDQARRLISALTPAEQAAILGGNAARFYALAAA